VCVLIRFAINASPSFVNKKEMVIESDKSYVNNSISQLTDHDSNSAFNSNMSNDSNNNELEDDVNSNDNDKVYEHILSNVQASPAQSTRSRLLERDSSTSKKRAAPNSPSRKTVFSTKKRSSKSGSQQKSKQAKHSLQQQQMTSTSKTLFSPKKRDCGE
jgi:hypothetical protein